MGSLVASDILTPGRPDPQNGVGQKLKIENFPISLKMIFWAFQTISRKNFFVGQNFPQKPPPKKRIRNRFFSYLSQ